MPTEPTTAHISILSEPAVLAQHLLALGLVDADIHAQTLPALYSRTMQLPDAAEAAFSFSAQMTAGGDLGEFSLVLRGYADAAEKRHTGFMVQMLVCAVLWIGALGAIVLRMMHA